MYASGDTGTDNDYNCVYNSGTTQFNGVVKGANSIESDPAMANPANADFALQSTSPCIDAGVDVSLVLDYYGDTVPYVNADCTATPDIGAIESVFCPSGTVVNSPVDSQIITIIISPNLDPNIDIKVVVIKKKRR